MWAGQARNEGDQVKHYTQGSRRKAKKINATPKPEAERGPQAERPTAERMARGVWTEPKGMGKHEIPVTDLAADMIGLLHYLGRITERQTQAALTFMEARIAYLAEIPDVTGYKSCIAGDVPGYDDGDGDPVVIERYRRMERALGRQGRIEMLWVCEGNHTPRSLDLLRWALDVVEDM